MMKWDKYLGVIIGSMIVSVSGVHAKFDDIRIELKRETVRAIHVATGCVSAVEYDDGVFVEAFITDPLCLPHGVTKRIIPASAHDFHRPKPVQALTISQ